MIEIFLFYMRVIDAETPLEISLFYVPGFRQVSLRISTKNFRPVSLKIRKDQCGIFVSRSTDKLSKGMVSMILWPGY